MKQLAQTLGRLEAPVHLFFRCDDAGWDQPALESLAMLFAERDLPLDLAVIPAALDPETAQGLLALRQMLPSLGLHQHGYAHVNHQPAAERKCEFGPARPVQRQIADVIAGRERLNALLGDWDPIFTPPWNRCSAELAGALGDHGFVLLSTDGHRTDAGAIGQLPVCFDWDRMRREDRTEERLCELFEAPQGPLGIMLHHAAMDDAARTDLAGLLDLIANCPSIEPLPMRHWIGE